jgi:polysaccharide export outer membrane protein
MTRIFISAFLVLLLTVLAYASTTPEYVLAPNDALAITVLDHPEINGASVTTPGASGTVTVGPDGMIQLPIVGPLYVQGKTLAEVTKLIETGLSKRFVDPEVTISLLKPHDDLVYVLGAVAKPSVYPYQPGQHITELLAEAGGLAVSVLDCQANLLRAATRASVPVSLRQALAGDPQANLTIDAGDVLNVGMVPTLPIYVSGYVKAPGLIQVPEGDGISKAITLAGGLVLKPEEVRITLVHGTQLLSVAFPPSPAATTQTALHAGDEVRVDSKLMTVYLDGKVKLPGAYPLREGLGVREAIALGGGGTDDAKLSAVVITHRDGTTATVDTWALADSGANVRLQPDDKIFVPVSASRIAVLGRVQGPGTFPMDEKHPYTVMDAIALAKGFDKRAKPKAVHILRMVNGKTQKFPVDLDAFLHKGNTAANITLQPGDVVFVPETLTPDWGMLLVAISSIGVFNADVTHF